MVERKPIRPAGAIREDLKNALEALVEQPGIGTSVASSCASQRSSAARRRLPRSASSTVTQ